MRRAGVTDAALVTAAMLIEAGISAVAGVLVLTASLPTVGRIHLTLWPVLAFAALLLVLMHPRVFRPAASFLLRAVGGSDVPALSYRTTLGLLAFYTGTWLIGGAALWFIVRSVGDAPLSAIAFLGGASDVGAIVTVLFVIAPSGLGVREASMYGLLLALVPEGTALGAVVLNRLLITAVEVVLLAGTALLPAPPPVEGAELEPASSP
jgi:uncharacterized membrane protein YbhN (UPF0104 family)